VDGIYELRVHVDAELDLDELWECDPDGAADVEVVLEELAADQELLAAMHIHQRLEGRLHFSRLLRFHIWGRNLWRAKIWELEDEAAVLPYRLIYGCVGQICYVLAVMHRDRGYDQDLQLVERVRKACRELGIPVVP
jgi:hypothetical protein